MKTSADLEKEAASRVLSLMAAAARTAPKTRGIDQVRVVGIDDPESKARLAARLRELAKTDDRPWFNRDATCLEKSLGVLLVGVAAKTMDLNCGYCGQPTCAELESRNGICAFNSIDLGIAASSAASVAADSRVDTRIMFSLGRAAISLNLFEGSVKQALGVPVSISGKSPFFDRTA